MGPTDTPAAATDLSSHARNVFSQNGEDGILERIFSLLGIERGWGVEFGAWDGTHLSNTYNLIKNHGWSAVMIEADPAKVEDLKRNMQPFEGVTCINRFVEFSPPNDLDGILASTDAPKDLDMLSIDIDGNDYHVWDSLTEYRPKVVVIEDNPTMPVHIEFVQERHMSVKHGSSLLSLTKLGERKGYTLVAAPGCNGIFVRDDLVSKLGEVETAIEKLRPGRENETSILHLFDGTLAIAGRRNHPWNGIELEDKRIQVLPAPLRTYTPEASKRTRQLQKLWTWIYKRRP